MKKITPWIEADGCAFRTLVGADPEDIDSRVAFIEKTPRVRIRSAYLGRYERTYDDGTPYVERQWEDFLNWCEGYKGSGPDDEESRAWCDNMLKALGFYSDV